MKSANVATWRASLSRSSARSHSSQNGTFVPKKAMKAAVASAGIADNASAFRWLSITRSMFRRVSAIVIFFAAGAGALQAQPRLPADESLVVAAALDTHVGQMFGSGGRFLLHQTPINPSPAQLDLPVFSPAN